ncbi:MAG: tRNA (adenosine(37)-N6)-threonylcarbamoyltransferase complex dimerization subunit type 1 TsaB [Ferruginibacter sp.]
MSLILNIDTSTDFATITLAEDGKVLKSISNTIQKDHAAFLHPAVNEVLQSGERKISDLDAIAVTAGPGSYTGIRVGLAAAKGLSLALNIPLITINTLLLLAKDAILNHTSGTDILFCPVIDARRMEVFTAVYNNTLSEILSPCTMILTNNSYDDFLMNNKVFFFGNGSEKLKNIIQNQNAFYIENVNIPFALSQHTYELYLSKSFTDLIYSEPFYLKEFYTGT